MILWVKWGTDSQQRPRESFSLKIHPVVLSMAEVAKESRGCGLREARDAQLTAKKDKFHPDAAILSELHDKLRRLKPLQGL